MPPKQPQKPQQGPREPERETQEAREAQEEDQILLRDSREAWHRAMLDGLFAAQPEGSEAEKSASRLQLERYETYQQEQAVTRVMAGNFLGGILRALAEDLRGEAEAREEAKRKLQELKKELPRFFETIGAHFRKETGEPEVADERDLILMRNFLHELSKIRSPEEIIDIVIENQAIIKMLAELTDAPEGQAPLSAYDINYEPESGEDMLALPEDQEYASRAFSNYRILDRFIRSLYQSGKSDQRKGAEASLAGAVVSKLSTEQKKYLISRMMIKDKETGFSGGEEGKKIATQFMLDLIGSGNMTRLDMMIIMDDLKFIDPSDRRFAEALRKKIDEAEKRWENTRRILDTNVKALRANLSGNIAARTLTRKKILFGIGGVVAGGITALVNAAVTVTGSMQGKKGFAALWAGVEGLFTKVPVNPYVLGGLAAAGFGADQLSGGWVQERILYSPDKEGKEVERKQKLERYVKRYFNQKPELLQYFAAAETGKENYALLRARAVVNQAEGRGYSLRDSDIPLRDKDIAFLGFTVPKNEKERQKTQRAAKKIIRDVFLVAGGALQIEDMNKLREILKADQYFQT